MLSYSLATIQAAAPPPPASKKRAIFFVKLKPAALTIEDMTQMVLLSAVPTRKYGHLSVASRTSMHTSELADNERREGQELFQYMAHWDPYIEHLSLSSVHTR